MPGTHQVTRDASPASTMWSSVTRGSGVMSAAALLPYRTEEYTSSTTIAPRASGARRRGHHRMVATTKSVAARTLGRGSRPMPNSIFDLLPERDDLARVEDRRVCARDDADE